MTSWNNFVESTALMVAGFTNRQEQVTHITEPLTISALTVTVDNATVVSAGSIVELGSELLHVSGVAGSTVTFSPFGRGYRGTAASAHDLNSKLTVSPAIPRGSVETALNESIEGTWPLVFGVSETEFVYNAAKSTYSLPSGAVKVLAASWDTLGPTEEWTPIRRFRMDANADDTDFVSGSTISIYDPVVPGRRVKVVYTHTPVRLTDGDVFTDSGLRDAAQDLVRYGAAYRLMPWLEVGHTPGNYAEPNYSAGLGRATSPTSTGRFLIQAYQLRLQEEAQALQSLYPIRSHYTR